VAVLVLATNGLLPTLWPRRLEGRIAGLELTTLVLGILNATVGMAKRGQPIKFARGAYSRQVTATGGHAAS